MIASCKGPEIVMAAELLRYIGNVPFVSDCHDCSVTDPWVSRESGPNEFDEFLLTYSRQDDPESRDRVEHEIWSRYGVRGAVAVFDMSGFSRLSRTLGVVHCLSMVLRMRLTARPAVWKHQGRIVKFEADNCFTWFPGC